MLHFSVGFSVSKASCNQNKCTWIIQDTLPTSREKVSFAMYDNILTDTTYQDLSRPLLYLPHSLFNYFLMSRHSGVFNFAITNNTVRNTSDQCFHTDGGVFSSQAAKSETAGWKGKNTCSFAKISSRRVIPVCIPISNV